MMVIDDDLIRQLPYLMADCVSQVLGIKDAFEQYNLVLIGFALFFKLSAQPDDVLTQYLSFFILHDACPNMQSAQRPICRHP